jgi:hypothetical protein
MNTTQEISVINERDRLVGRTAWAMAWFGLVAGQLHALARFRTEDGKSDLDLPLTGVWARPAEKLFGPLLDWASPNTVYNTYGKLWILVFLAFTAVAFAAYRRRLPTGFEKWAWRVVLFAYPLACVAVTLEFWTQWGEGNEKLLNTVFLLEMPVILLTMLSSTVLGAALLIKSHRPLAPAIVLALTLPLVFLISQATSLGNAVLPIAFAFGILGRRW